MHNNNTTLERVGVIISYCGHASARGLSALERDANCCVRSSPADWAKIL